MMDNCSCIQLYPSGKKGRIGLSVACPNASQFRIVSEVEYMRSVAFGLADRTCRAAAACFASPALLLGAQYWHCCEPMIAMLACAMSAKKPRQGWEGGRWMGAS